MTVQLNATAAGAAVPDVDPDVDPDLDPGARMPRRARWSTRRWLTAGAGAAIVLLVVLSAIVVATFDHGARSTNRLVGRILPSQTAAAQLEAAMANQETGVRGYALTGRSDFLQPYTMGLAQEQAALAALAPLIATDSGARADLAAVESRAAAWQAGVAEPIAAVPAGTPPPTAAERVEQGKPLFDRLRAALEAEQADLRQAVAAGHADLAGVRSLRDAIFTAIGVTILLALLTVFVGLRFGVEKPLALLSAGARRVAEGDFTHPVVPSGPADLRAMANDIEAMRRRLVAELAAVDAARAALDVQAEELRRSNQELEQFAYVASHDLQEPLRKVTSFCQLLQRRYAERLDERANQYIGFAVDGAQRMQQLISDLLDFSRTGRSGNAFKPVDLRRVLGAAMENLHVSITETRTRVDYDRLPTVLGDATQLTQLVQNLLSNAIKFRTPGRPPHIRVSAEADGDTWRLAVTDNGIGVSPEYAERIFLIFQRLHTKDAYPGSGIGLAMCRRIVEYHGGQIELDAAHRDGTRISFTLPASSGAVA